MSIARIATGCYSRSGTGRGDGVVVHELEEDGKPVALRELSRVDLPDPSFVLWSPTGHLLYAITETDPARLVAIGVDDHGAAEIRGELELAGTHPCHLAFAPNPAAILVAHYGSGDVETVRIAPDGLPVETVDVDRHGSAESRAAGAEAHPHQIVRLPGTGLLAVPDLGLDRVFLHRQDAAGQVDLAGEIALPRGSGPRHLAADHEAAALYVTCELSGEVATIRRAPAERRGEANRWRLGGVVRSSGREGEASPSHLELVADESGLLVANRGVDALSLFSLAASRPELVAEAPVGATPRHFARLGELVLVAAQDADRIDVLRLRGERLESVGEPLACPSVTCIAVRPTSR